MNQEMMLFQARQDFIDMHKDLLAGRRVTVEKYDQLATELQKMDALNFEQMLDFTETYDKIPVKQMWEHISAHIENAKKEGNWRLKKQSELQWENDQLYVHTNPEHDN